MIFLKKLDARTKLLCVLLITVLIFLIDRIPSVLCLVIFLVIFRLTAQVPFRSVKFFINLTLLAAFIILLQTLFFPGENYILKPLIPQSFFILGGAGSLKWEGFYLGLVITCRLFALMILFPVFTETTSPHRIACGLCAMKFNYRTAFIITSAFNLIPLFKQEAMLIIDAQKLRGLNSFEKVRGVRRPLFSGLRAYLSLLLPLILGAMRKAQNSAAAMDSRAFGIYKTKTWLDKSVLKARDFAFFCACIVFIACILFINYCF
ncbi:MAG: energy-coupling factor transporter transmembrane protein EcfT [Treponema sp.]|nr:energy-coupling factor transporter transmembrane protein EcfT [Treponema sp.]